MSYSLLSVLLDPRDERLAAPALLQAIRDSGNHIEVFMGDPKELWDLPEFDIYLSPAVQDAPRKYSKMGRFVGRLARERGALWWQWSLWLHENPNLIFLFEKELALSSGAILSRSSLAGKPYGETLLEKPSPGIRHLDPKNPFENSALF